MSEHTDLVNQVFLRHLPEQHTLGQHTNFFEAGFTSARLTAVLAELVDAGVELGLVDLFRFPTLRELTTELDRRTDAAVKPAAVKPTARRALPWET